MGLYHNDTPEAAHAASEIEPEERDCEVSSFFHGLMAALGLTAACLVIAHLLARFL
jgi:hypothetical protein